MKKNNFTYIVPPHKHFASHQFDPQFATFRISLYNYEATITFSSSNFSSYPCVLTAQLTDFQISFKSSSQREYVKRYESRRW